MRDRLSLQTILEAKLGTRNVYFQPPESKRLSYPCIIYEMQTPSILKADDTFYHGMKRYKITVIDKNPDSTIYERILVLPYATMAEPPYVAENLYHFVLTLYY